MTSYLMYNDEEISQGEVNAKVGETIHINKKIYEVESIRWVAVGYQTFHRHLILYLVGDIY